VLWIVTFVVTRYASVASLLTALALPVACFALGAAWPVVAFAGAACAGVVLLHRKNVGRLRSGTEPRFQRRPRASSPAS
jgi:glycerol-3-phosphate acyltransferase PlsY